MCQMKISHPFFVEAYEILEEYTEPSKILVGDFNMVLDPIVDRRGSTVNYNKSLEIQTLYMQEKMMYDIWYLKNKDIFCFTWRRSRP